MNTLLTIMARRSLILIAFVLVGPFPNVLAMTQILPEAKVDGDPQHINEIISTFDRAQEAIRARDLDALMDLYARNYHYHRLRKTDIRHIWSELFSHYDFIAALLHNSKSQ